MTSNRSSSTRSAGPTWARARTTQARSPGGSWSSSTSLAARSAPGTSFWPRTPDGTASGSAVAVNDGVVAAVIPNAHTASLAEIATQRRDIAERARAGKLSPSDISDATFTISNLGMYQVDQFSAIITPPQAAILAVGGIADRVVAAEGKPIVRPMMTLTISCDHRVADGARAALFLKDLAEALQAPSNLLT